MKGARRKGKRKAHGAGGIEQSEIAQGPKLPEPLTDDEVDQSDLRRSREDWGVGS